jgi:hypothetical protein
VAFLTEDAPKTEAPAPRTRLKKNGQEGFS